MGDNVETAKDGGQPVPVETLFATYWLHDFPMPPTVNESLMPVGKRLVSTTAARLYKMHYMRWALEHSERLRKIKSTIDLVGAELHSQGLLWGLKVDCYFCFPESKLVTKGTAVKMGWLKKIDANNRLKGALDGIAHSIGIDDSLFISGNCEKRVSRDDQARVQVAIQFDILKHEGKLKSQAIFTLEGLEGGQPMKKDSAKKEVKKSGKSKDKKPKGK